MTADAPSICMLIANFRSGGDSVAQLLKSAGVLDESSLPPSSELASFLSSRPELVESWLRWSQDKRVSSGWYFSPGSNGFVVGYYPNGVEMPFQNKILACAEFVRQEAGQVVRDLRSNNSLERTRDR
jgi:hypothetical protein